MKIRALLAAVLVSLALGACTRTATAPEASETSILTPSFNGTTSTPPPDTTTANRGGGALGNGH